MASTTLGPGTRLSVRPYETGDQEAVLALVNADLITGQPVPTALMLADALAGRSMVDAGWWAELDRPTTDVVHDPLGRVLGVISYAARPSDGVGFILWLHGREEPAVLATLISHAVSVLGRRTVHAFEFASALGLGLEGLPARRRSATRVALEAAGFTGRDLWRYMHAALPIAGLPRAAHYRTEPSEDPPGRRLEVRGGDRLSELWAEAMIGCPVAGVGVLWWIGVDPAHRGRGLGQALLGSALDLLHGLGASEAILFVDDDAGADDPERSRTAANRLYDRTGFTEVDRLWSFTRHP
ncbi:MAG: GNAT family N-acetyltransferase [Pseudonocardiales bacterium]